MIIFCSDCVYCQYLGRRFKCKASGRKEKDAIDEWVEFDDCRIRNKNNDCTEYIKKESWWKHLFRKRGQL